MNQNAIERLNELLRQEISAAETYDMALGRSKHTGFVEAIRQLRDEHTQRIALIREKIREVGGEPAEGSGVWGAWAKTVQAGADLLGDKTAVAALEQGEDHGVELYEQAARDENVIVRDFVTSVLLPKQQKSHSECRALKSFVKKAA